jgi:hypothetical protein
MKLKKLLLFAFRLAVAIALASVATLPLAAQDRDDRDHQDQDRDHHRDHRRECSLRTLHGRYGIFVQGTVLATSGPSAHPAFPFVVSGVFTYDGEGNVSGTYNQSVGGGILTGQTADGTYQVNPDCTYSAQFGPPGGPFAHRVGTITGEGMQQEIHILYTDPPSVAFGTLKKIRERPCSLKTLKGAYALFGQGTIFPPAPASPLADATAGILTFDGEGNFSGEDTANINGTSAPVTFTGTYAVTPDCAVSADIYTSNGRHLTEAGSITGEGEFKELHDIFTTPGWVFTDTLKKQ